MFSEFLTSETKSHFCTVIYILVEYIYLYNNYKRARTFIYTRAIV